MEFSPAFSSKKRVYFLKLLQNQTLSEDMIHCPCRKNCCAKPHVRKEEKGYDSQGIYNADLVNACTRCQVRCDCMIESQTTMFAPSTAALKPPPPHKEYL